MVAMDHYDDWTPPTTDEVLIRIQSVQRHPNHNKPIRAIVVTDGVESEQTLGIFNHFEFKTPRDQIRFTHPALFERGSIISIV